MKNILAFLGIFFCITSNTFAQDEKILIGAKGGLNIASLSNTGSASASFGSNSSSFKNKPRLLFHVGGYSEFKINDFFSIQPELLFSVKGFSTESKAKSGSSSSESKTKGAFYYIDIPVQMRFNTGKGFHILAGPYLGILLGAKSKVEATATNGSTTTTTKSTSTDKRGLNSTDVGMYLGLGYEMESGLNFGARWCRGFSDVTPGPFLFNANNSNSVFQFSVGYKLAGF